MGPELGPKKRVFLTSPLRALIVKLHLFSGLVVEWSCLCAARRRLHPCPATERAARPLLTSARVASTAIVLGGATCPSRSCRSLFHLLARDFKCQEWLQKRHARRFYKAKPASCAGQTAVLELSVCGVPFLGPLFDPKNGAAFFPGNARQARILTPFLGSETATNGAPLWRAGAAAQAPNV